MLRDSIISERGTKEKERGKRKKVENNSKQRLNGLELKELNTKQAKIHDLTSSFSLKIACVYGNVLLPILN